MRVIRGGTYYHGASEARSTSRYKSPPEMDSISGTGFRVAARAK